MKVMYYQYGQNRIFGAKFDPEIYKRGILFIGSPGRLGRRAFQKKTAQVWTYV